MQQHEGKQSKWPTRLRISGFIIALLILIVGATILAFNSLTSLPGLITTIFGALAVIFALLSLIPIVFPQKSSDAVSPPQLASVTPPITIYNVLPSPQIDPPLPAPTTSLRTSSSAVPSSSNLLTLRALPLPTNSQSIQQRETIVKEIDVASVLPQNQAFAVFNALTTADTADTPRLIILDQFENFFDPLSGRALPVQSGVGEFLDALNSQSCACRVLLTSRARPHGTREDALASLRMYRIGGFDSAEGIAFLRSQGVIGREEELREAVKRCGGHALSLAFLSTLLQTYQVRLATLLHESSYLHLWEGRIAQNLLDRIFTSLPEPSRQLLCAFSVYREAVAIDATQAIIPGTTKAQILTILGSLLEQHLIQAQATSGHYLLHPIVIVYAQEHFVLNDEAANAQAKKVAHAKAAHYYLQVAVSSCPPADTRRRISDVQPLIEAVWQLGQAGQFQEAYELMEREFLFSGLWLWGGNTILLELCQLLLSESWPFTQQQRVLIYSTIAATLSVLGQQQEALKYFEQALLIRREVGDRRGEGTALHNLGMIYYRQSRYEVALACILLAKVLFERVQSPSDVDDEVQWIAGLRKSIGEKQFIALLARVEPRAGQMVEEMLRNGLSDN